MKTRNKVLLFFLILGLSLARFIYLGSVPGLHGDEALYGYKTYIMLHKPFTLIGFNSYTGPIISYSRMPFYYLLGINIFSLRTPIVILSLISIFFIYRLLKEIYNSETGIIGALLFLSMPWSFIESRFADETHTSLILFAACGLYYLIINKKLSSKLLAALFLGMGVFNHSIFIILLISYFIYFLIKNKFRMKLDKRGILFIFIVFSFFLVRLGLILRGHFFWPEGSGIYYNFRQAVENLIPKFTSLVPHFLNMIDGSIFFERTTGRILFFVIPLNSFLFILSFLTLIFRYRRNPEFKEKDRIFLSIFILNYFLNAIFLMEFALRYFLVTLMFATILIAIFIGTGNIRTSIRAGCLSIIIITNCLYIWYDYIYSFRKTGGRIHYFTAGNFIETSKDFVDSTGLYDYLKKGDIKDIWEPERFRKWQLMFLDINQNRLNIKTRLEDIPSDRIYFISYKGGRSPESYGLSKAYSINRKKADLNNYEIFLIQKREH